MTVAERFAASEFAAEKGFEHTTPIAGAKMAADRTDEITGLEPAGANGPPANMGRLERELGKDEPNGMRIKSLLGKIVPAAVKLADKSDDEKGADKVRARGETSSRAA